jgi:hypothetical protein
VTKFDRIDRLCARRAQDGRRVYGCMDLDKDPRDFSVEAQEEVLDAINYIRWAMARGDRSLVDGAIIVHFLKGIYRMMI